MDEREGGGGHSHPHAADAHGADGVSHERHGHDDRHGQEDGRPRICFVGAGHVGSALGVAFARAGWEVSAVASRDEAARERFRGLVPGARAFAEAQAVLDEGELIFLTVPDDALPELAGSLLLYSGQALVHTSGALPAGVLRPAMAAGTSIGSFHPLVAFADHERALADLAGATVAIEGDESLLPLLAELAESIGARPVRLPEAGKPAYHAAALLAAGGLVGLLDAIVEVGRAAGLDERSALAVYVPLARQALANAQQLGVDAALTGPFMRGDAGTIAGHLAVLGSAAPAALPLYLAVARRELAIAERRGLSAARAAEIRRLLDATG